MTRTNKVLYSEDRRLREPSAPPAQAIQPNGSSSSRILLEDSSALDVAMTLDGGGGAADAIMQWQSRRLDTAHLVQPASVMLIIRYAAPGIPWRAQIAGGTAGASVWRGKEYASSALAAPRLSRGQEFM